MQRQTASASNVGVGADSKQRNPPPEPTWKPSHKALGHQQRDKQLCRRSPGLGLSRTSPSHLRGLGFPPPTGFRLTPQNWQPRAGLICPEKARNLFSLVQQQRISTPARAGQRPGCLRTHPATHRGRPALTFPAQTDPDPGEDHHSGRPSPSRCGASQ